MKLSITPGALEDLETCRITEKDRLVYDIQSDVITVIACRFHYDDH